MSRTDNLTSLLRITPPLYHPLAVTINKTKGGGMAAAAACWECHVGEKLLEASAVTICEAQQR